MRYLRYERERQQLTQDQLSALSGVPQNAISLAERGVRKPHAATLEKLAKVLGVPEPAMLALNMSSVETYDQLINGSAATRREYLTYKRDVGRLKSLVEDLEEIYAAAMNDHGIGTLTGARVQAGYMLGYFRCALDFGVVEEREKEEHERGAIAVKS